MKANLTVAYLRALPFEPCKPKFITDRNLRGFGVKVLRRSKVFFFEKRIHGKPKRITLGRFPDLTLEQARQTAIAYHSELAKGNDPFKARPAKTKARRINLREVGEAYFITRNNLRPQSVLKMQYVLNRYLKPWLDLHILDITGQMALELHREITVNHGAVIANISLKYLRSFLNLAKIVYKDRLDFSNWENPVRIFAEARAWNPVKRRTRVVPKDKLGSWFNAVLAVRRTRRHPTTIVGCDYLLFLALTGMRRTEAASLTWGDVSLEAGYVSVKSEITKNHAPHRLPFSDYLQALMEKRWRERVNHYVFPGNVDRSATGHIRHTRNTVNRVTALSGVDFSYHDLRRTFISTAEYLNLNHYVIKRLANHKISKDETAEYISSRFDADRLRGPMQQITDFILAQAGLREPNPPKQETIEPGLLIRLQSEAKARGMTLDRLAQILTEQVIGG